MAALALSKGRDRVDTDLPQGFFRRNADFLRFSILRPFGAFSPSSGRQESLPQRQVLGVSRPFATA